jgi:hypothetical protein
MSACRGGTGFRVTVAASRRAVGGLPLDLAQSARTAISYSGGPE